MKRRALGLASRALQLALYYSGSGARRLIPAAGGLDVNVITCGL